jgi:SAM-dependent methyltransferase
MTNTFSATPISISRASGTENGALSGTYIENHNGLLVGIKRVVFHPSSIVTAIVPLGVPKGGRRRTDKRGERLWSRYREGVRMDREAWYEMTPENVALYVAWRLKHKSRVFDACCGVGGNSIQFALMGSDVVAVDISQSRIEMAKHNATVYRADSRVIFVCEDILSFLIRTECDTTGNSTLFMSPPWGGYDCYTHESLPVSELAIGLRPILQAAWRLFHSFAVYLPRNISLDSVWDLLSDIGVTHCELEHIVYSDPEPHLKGFVLYADRNCPSGPSVFSMRRDASRISFMSINRYSKAGTLLMRCLSEVNWIQRYIRHTAERLDVSGISFEPFSVLDYEVFRG